MINKAFEHIQQGEFQQAEEILRSELEINPQNMAARQALAMAQLGQSDYTAVEQTLLPVLQADPVNVQALVFMGAALLEQGRAQDSMKFLQRVTRRQSDNVQAQFCLARAYFADNKAAFAEPCLQKALKVEPDNGELLDWLGRVQLGLNRIDDAKRSFEMARQADQKSPGMFKDFARVETILGNVDEALDLYAQAVAMAPEDYEMAYTYADMLVENEKYDLASQQLERLRSAGYQADQVSGLLANSFARQGRRDEALSLLAELQRQPEIQPSVRLLISIVLRLCDQAETADEHLEILLALNPPLPEAVLIRARQMYAANDKQAIDLLADLLKRRDLNSWQINQARTLLAFVLEKAGYEPINPPERKPATQAGTVEPNLAPEPIPGWNPADLNSPAAHVKASGQIPGQAPADSQGELAVTAMNKKVTGSWPSRPPDDGNRQPVFVFAWPGSGREQLLGSLTHNAGLIYMPNDEGSQARRRERLTDRLGAKALSAMDSNEVMNSRRLYWRSAGGGAALPAQVVPVDLQRLGAEMLPTIARYFPAAPVIILSRDPRDMAVFWKKAELPDLANFATLYQSQILQLKLCRASLPLNFVNVDFDELCANPEAELEQIQRSIGVEPDARVLDKFQSTIAEFPPNGGVWKAHEADLAEVFARFN